MYIYVYICIYIYVCMYVYIYICQIKSNRNKKIKKSTQIISNQIKSNQGDPETAPVPDFSEKPKWGR